MTIRALSAARGAVLALAVALAHPAPASEWRTAAPREAGFTSDLGDRLDAALASGEYEGIHSVVLIRYGQLVFERYLAGDDEIWGRPKRGVVFGPDSLHDLRSITKSVVGLLYGIALADGLVPPPAVAVLEAFPSYTDLAGDPARRAITVGHVLSMTMGSEWDETTPYGEDANSETAMNRAPDSVRYALDRPLVSSSGERWTYNGGTTTILAEMIARGSGRDLAAYARETLFDPLGIGRVEWILDYYGRPYAHSGLRLRPRDTAKLGQLVLQDGAWNGVQIVPSAWIAESSKAQAEAQEPGCRYGYQWWLCETRTGVKIVEGAGYGGQHLLIQRDLDLVFVVNAGLYGEATAWKRAYGLLENVVLPAISSR